MVWGYHKQVSDGDIKRIMVWGHRPPPPSRNSPALCISHDPPGLPITGRTSLHAKDSMSSGLLKGTASQ